MLSAWDPDPPSTGNTWNPPLSPNPSPSRREKGEAEREGGAARARGGKLRHRHGLSKMPCRAWGRGSVTEQTNRATTKERGAITEASSAGYLCSASPVKALMRNWQGLANAKEEKELGSSNDSKGRQTLTPTRSDSPKSIHKWILLTWIEVGDS